MCAVPTVSEQKELEAFVLCPTDRQLLRVRLADNSIESNVVSAVDASAVRLVVDQNDKRVYVSNRWAHRVDMLSLDSNFTKVTKRQSITLPFAPRELLLLPDGKTLLAADAFGSRIAVVETDTASIARVERIRGHNIRGLAVSNDSERVLVAHQELNPLARADYDDLHWGVLVSNGVRVFDTNSLSIANSTASDIKNDDDPTLNGWLDHFGDIGNATGDPANVISGEKDMMAVALGGIGEVLVRRAGYLTRIRVGQGPEAMAVAANRLYVAIRFDDSISVIDLDVGKVDRTMSVGPTGTATARDRGEKLFFDAKLSHDGWISCHSCHTDGHSAGLLVDTLGDGEYGAPKRVPSLLGTRGTAPWAWNGAMKTLASQVKKSVTTTMHGGELSDRKTNDLVAFLETLEPAPPRETVSHNLVTAGRSVFEANGCSRCHDRSKLTSEEVFDVGLFDEHKNNMFNPPSLRGVSQRDRLFHDGRAKGVEDVVLRFQHMLEKRLSDDDAKALLSYLKSL